MDTSEFLSSHFTENDLSSHPNQGETDAGNGSKAVCRVCNVLRSPSPDRPKKFHPVTAIKPDAETTMAIHKATGLPVMQAMAFITTSSAELIQRILAGYRVRHTAHLAQLNDELASRIIGASDTQEDAHFLRDPIENDPRVGPTVRRVIEDVSRELETVHADDRPMGLCHLIWRTTQERLLQDHSIVWYSPAQMNPGSCFD
jgi:hypothetical protein